MDLNTKIIEGVREYPSLYDDKGNLDERNQAWLQLAEKLKMHEVYLKIRWHSLMQAYQRNLNFKYANNMDFVPRTKDTHKKEEGWPEFIITEEDLKDDRRGEQPQEEFVYLEIDEEDNKAKEIPKETVKEREARKPKQIEDMANLEIKTKDLENPVVKKQEIETKNENKITQNVEVKENNIDNPKEVGTNIATSTTKVEEQKPAVEVKETKEVVVEKKHIPNERSEDVIFGELVSATLKHMDEAKKRNIKKEIMNLLFS